MRSVQKLLPLLPALLMAACATQSPAPTVASPRLPAKPSISTPVPQEPYSVSASNRIENWRKRLMGTLLMSGD